MLGRLSLLVAVMVLAGCKPRAGGSCEGDTRVCADKQTRLACVDGKYVATTCPGEGGCEPKKDGATCDLTGAEKGATCAPNGLIACSDPQTLLTCMKGAFETYPCRGTGGCYEASCNQLRTEKGDRCRIEGSASCSVDGKERHKCIGGQVVLEGVCEGPKKCSLGPVAKGCNPGIPGSCDVLVYCDQTIKSVGEICAPDEAACTKDRASMLTCVSGKLAVATTCRGPKGCWVEDLTRKIYCDTTVAKVGDPCEPNTYSCREDRRAILECKGAAFAVKREGCACSFVDKPDLREFSCK